VLKAAAATVMVTVGVASFGVLLVMVLAGRSAAGLAQPIDDAARTWIEAGTSRTDPFASILDVVCGAGAMTLWAALGGLVMWWRTRRPLLAVAPFVIALAADSVALAVKQTVARPRPAVMAGALGDRYSFPSGHATVAAAVIVAVALLWFGPERRTVALVASGVVVALVAASRLVLGVHWLSDVVVGAALGTSLAVSVTRVGRGVFDAERLAGVPARRTR
jgi:membrane-associated phospholipid phosphatase